MKKLMSILATIGLVSGASAGTLMTEQELDSVVAGRTMEVLWNSDPLMTQLVWNELTLVYDEVLVDANDPLRWVLKPVSGKGSRNHTQGEEGGGNWTSDVYTDGENFYLVSDNGEPTTVWDPNYDNGDGTFGADVPNPDYVSYDAVNTCETKGGGCDPIVSSNMNL